MVGSRLGSNTKHRMVAVLHQGFARWERQRAGDEQLISLCWSLALVAKVLHPHVLGDNSSTEVTAGRKHRTHLHKALYFIYITKENRTV